MKMIADQKHHAVLCGHSERRQYHYETDAFVAEQVESALKHGLHPVICVGESAEEREAGKEKQVVQTQVEAVLSKCEDAEVTFAYEPVWAIGTGNTATPDDAEEMHAFIRSLLPHPDTSRIIYGGSMKPENAEELLKMPNIDGGLVGGASLIPEQFQEMIATAEKLV
jgi:triosephosphate isomerase